MTVAVTCTAVLATLVLALGMNVSRLRGERQRVGAPQFPADPADGLFKAVRAHGNAAEYVPTLAVLMLVAGAHSPAAWVVVAMAGATVSRLVHAAGIFASRSLALQSPVRLAGAVGTYVFGLALVAAALLTV